jgi:RNA polymerase sigma-70 factor (ECF subfamily)
MMAFAEARLVERARAGDVQAFEALMARHAGRVRACAYRITRNETDAEEVVQDVFVSMFRKLATFEGRAGLGTWLYRVATHAALDRRRGKRAGRDMHFEDLETPSKKGRGRGLDWDVQGDASSPTPESEFLSRETRSLIRAAIDRLPAPRQLVLRLMTLEGLSCEATARIVGESVAAVKSRLHRARKTLRTQLPTLRTAASKGGPRDARPTRSSTAGAANDLVHAGRRGDRSWDGSAQRADLGTLGELQRGQT